MVIIKKTYISDLEPRVMEGIWLKPVSGGFAAYIIDGGQISPMKLVDDNSTKTTADDTAQTANELKKSVVGKSTDSKTANTINGAKTYADDAAATAKSEVVGSAQDTAEDMTLFGLKAYIDSKLPSE